MVRIALSVIAGVVVWIVVVTVIDRTMRNFWPDYAHVFEAMAFTLPMMLARLAESTVALIVASLVTVRVAKGQRPAPWALGILMFAFFAPYHYTLWPKFPIWYHAYFLLSLIAVPVLVAGGMRVSQPTGPQH
ncbi:MAG: hypothetical protein WDM89_09590 [Rhizomicrobium sp.]